VNARKWLAYEGSEPGQELGCDQSQAGTAENGSPMRVQSQDMSWVMIKGQVRDCKEGSELGQ
jgi:hypothetical protein